MNILKKKLKKVNKVKKILYFFTSLVFLVTYIYFLIGLLHLSGIETLIRIIVLVFFGIWFVVYLLAGLLALISRKTPTFIILTIISLLCTPAFFFGSNIIIKNVGFLNQTQRDEILKKLNIEQSTPTTVVVENGKVVDTQVGYVAGKEYVEFFKIPEIHFG